MFEGLPRPWNWRCTRLPQAGGTLGTWWILGVVPSAGRRASGQVRSITQTAPKKLNPKTLDREIDTDELGVRLGSVDVRGDWLGIPGQAWKMGVGVWLRNHAHIFTPPGAATVGRLLANMAVAIRLYLLPAASAAAVEFKAETDSNSVIQQLNEGNVTFHWQLGTNLWDRWRLCCSWSDWTLYRPRKTIHEGQIFKCTDDSNLSLSSGENSISKGLKGKSLGWAKLRSPCHSQCGRKMQTFLEFWLLQLAETPPNNLSYNDTTNDTFFLKEQFTPCGYSTHLLPSTTWFWPMELSPGAKDIACVHSVCAVSSKSHLFWSSDDLLATTSRNVFMLISQGRLFSGRM